MYTHGEARICPTFCYIFIFVTEQRQIVVKFFVLNFDELDGNYKESAMMVLLHGCENSQEDATTVAVQCSNTAATDCSISKQ